MQYPVKQKFKIDLLLQVNSLGVDIIKEFETALREIEMNPQIQAAVLISNKPDCFIAGADITMLEQCKTLEEVLYVSKTGQKLLSSIETSKKPFIAAIQGVCLGGGLEVALACHYRIAVKDRKTGLGLPEVMLGLLPGSGGTQRLPKLTNIANTLDMVLTGKTIKADKAKKFGIVDLLVDPLGPGLGSPQEKTREYLEQVSVLIAKQIASGKLKVERGPKNFMEKAFNFALQYNFVRDKIFQQARAKVMKMSGGLYPAPLRVGNCFIHYPLK